MNINNTVSSQASEAKYIGVTLCTNLSRENTYRLYAARWDMVYTYCTDYLAK